MLAENVPKGRLRGATEDARWRLERTLQAREAAFQGAKTPRPRFEMRRVHAPVWSDHSGERRHCISDIERIKRDDGAVIGMLGAPMEVTDLRRAEEALRESEALYRTLGEAVPDFVWLSDANGKAQELSRTITREVRHGPRRGSSALGRR